MSNTELTTVSTEKRELSHMTNARLDDSLFSKDLAPHYMQLASKLASSELVPKSFRGKPQDLFICWAMGYQIGLAPEQAMQCIAVINGKPAMWGDDMLALCMAHKEFDDIIEKPIMKGDAIVGYTCIVKRKGKADKENVFTLDMAKKAGLLAKGGVWTQYTERMLKLRARGFSLRDAFPDALKGIKPREEVEDYIEAEYKVVDDKMSRTEFLKKDLLTRQGTQDAQDTQDTQVETQDSKNKNDANDSDERERLDEIGGAEGDVLGADSGLKESETLGEDKIQVIYRLIEEKQFSQERLDKALSYYEARSIEEMSAESMAHFIKQLEKA